MLFFFILKMIYFVYSLESLDEAILMRTHNISSLKKKKKKNTPILPPDLAL